MNKLMFFTALFVATTLNSVANAALRLLRPSITTIVPDKSLGSFTLILTIAASSLSSRKKKLQLRGLTRKRAMG